MRKTRQKSNRVRLERKIFAMLAFFSVSVGLWENFRQLWLQENGLTAPEVSSLTSIATFVSIGGVVIIGHKLKMRQIRPFMIFVLILKALNLGILFQLNSTNSPTLINVCTLIDILTSYLILTAVYPLITTITKSNRIYSKRKLVEYLFRDLGVLVGGILIGQHFAGIGVSYNICLLVSILFLIPAAIILFTMKTQTSESAPIEKFAVIKYVLHSKIQRVYMVYAFLAATSFAAALGLKMLMLTNYLELSAGTATNYLLIVGLLSDVIGIIALQYFTPKNDYITMTLKFGIRLIAYALVVITDNPFMSLLAITWSILISTAYEDVTDGYYINCVDNRHQLGYNTIKHVMTYSGEAVGILLCGMMYDFGMSYIFGLSAAIMIVQMAIAYYLIYLRHHQHKTRQTASRTRYHERLTNPEE